MAVYGYARVSTRDQLLERQIRNIKKAHPEIQTSAIFQEQYTGTTMERPVFKKLLRRLKPGDTIVLDSVSRFSRTADEGFQLYEELYSKGVNLEFIKEPLINTANYRQAMQIHLPEVEQDALKPLMEGLEKTLLLLAKEQYKQAFEQAEKEVLDTRQRIREGFSEEVRADLSRKMAGKPRRSPKREKAFKAILKHSKDFGGSLSDKELIQLLGCDRKTFYRYKKQLKSQ